MNKEELQKYSKFNEEELTFFERISLQKLTKKGSQNIIKIFNKNPNHLKKHELIYIAKYLGKEYSFYESENKLYIAPSDANKDVLLDFGVPENAYNDKTSDEFYTENGIGYRNLRIYSMMPGVKYKLMKGHSLTGYASIDEPWKQINHKYNLENVNMLDFYNNGRPKFYKCKYAFQDGEDKTTWDDFEKLVNDYSKSLIALGVTEGEIVPVCTKNIMKAVAIYFALDKIGATTFFLDPADTGLERLNSEFKKHDVKYVVTTNGYASKINEAITDTGVKNIVSLDYKKESNNNINSFVVNEQKFIENGRNINLEDYKYNNDLNHVTLLTSTSGTTGNPKLVELSRKNIMYEMLYMMKTTMLNLGKNGVNMQVVSFEYPYGFAISAMCTLFAGKTLGLCSNLNFDNYINYLRLYKPVYIHGIPPFYKQMINDPRLENENMDYLEYPISGGDYYSTSDIDKTNEFLKKHNSKAKIKNGFGSAEGTACVTAGTVGKYNIESVGKPLNGIIVKIIDSDMNEMPYNHLGKIAYTGGNVMKSYNGSINLSDSGKTIMSDGKEWIVTDAIGFIDNEGFVYIVDREKNLFITLSETGSGFKIYPNNVSRIIGEVEGVADVIVVKQEHQSRGYVPVAFITLNDGYEYNTVVENIKKNCQSKLDSYAIPVNIYLEDKIVHAKSDKVMTTYYEERAQKLYKEEKKEKAYGVLK